MAGTVIGVQALDMMLAKVQLDNLTPATGLAHATDLIYPASGFTISHEQGVTAINNATGLYGQQASVLGSRSGKVAFDLDVIPTASVTEPEIVKFLKMSGFKNTLATKKCTLARSSTETDWTWGTFWGYTGNKASSGDSTLTKIEGVLLDFTAKWVIGKPVTFSFSGMGAAENARAAASYPATDTTQPTLSAPSFLGATITFFGSTLKLTEFTLTAGNSIQLIQSPASACGYLYAEIGDIKAKWSAVAYNEDASANYPAIDTGSVGTVDIAFGATDSKIQIASGASKCQITKVADSNQNGVKTFALEGIFIDNDYSIVVNG